MAPYATSQTADVSDALYELIAASEYNRELHRLVNALVRLAGRLDAFNDLDPTAELIHGLRTRGFDQATAVMEVVEFLESADGPDVVQEAIRSLVWLMNSAVGELRG